MGEKKYRASVVVTDAGQDSSQSRVTDLESGRSVVVENQADAVAQAIRDMGKK